MRRRKAAVPAEQPRLSNLICASPTPGHGGGDRMRRFDFDGEDKARMERVQKFYAAEYRRRWSFDRFRRKPRELWRRTWREPPDCNWAWRNWRCCWKPPAATRRASRWRSRS